MSRAHLKTTSNKANRNELLDFNLSQRSKYGNRSC